MGHLPRLRRAVVSPTRPGTLATNDRHLARAKPGTREAALERALRLARAELVKEQADVALLIHVIDNALRA